MNGACPYGCAPFSFKRHISSGLNGNHAESTRKHWQGGKAGCALEIQAATRIVSGKIFALGRLDLISCN